jgi:predicted Ser/Thr protein kinase
MSRNTHKRQIIHAAQTSANEAEDIAAYGHVTEPPFWQVKSYYITKNILAQIKKGRYNWTAEFLFKNIFNMRSKRRRDLIKKLPQDVKKETFVKEYHAALKSERIRNRLNRQFLEESELNFKMVEYVLGLDFMAAVAAGDFKRIQAIADAVRILEGKPIALHRIKDPERMFLLILKNQLDLVGARMPIRRVAEFLAWAPKNYIPDTNPISLYPSVETPADGFSALRVKCKEINFPLAPTRKIRKK